jgi:TetR/AcrR family fatty acid metabolism transcriptional regulator
MNAPKSSKRQTKKSTPRSKSIAASTESGASAQAERDKYKRILDAAVAIFAEKGFNAARISDVATRASVAAGTIYLYFKSKDELLTVAMQAIFEGFMARARAELQSTGTPAEKLRQLARIHLEHLGSNRDLAVISQMELRHSARFLAPFSRQQMAEYFALVGDIVRQGQDQGGFRPGFLPEIAAKCYFGALDEMVTSWLLNQPVYPLSDVAESVVDIILLGLES